MNCNYSGNLQVVSRASTTDSLTEVLEVNKEANTNHQHHELHTRFFSLS